MVNNQSIIIVSLMIIIQKKLVRAIKLILVSLLAEKLAMLLRVLSLSVLLFFSLADFDNGKQWLIIQQDVGYHKLAQLTQQFYLASNRSDLNAILLTLQESWHQLIQPTNTELFIGALRLVQYTVQLPEKCQYDYFGIFQEEEQRIMLNSLSDECNPHNQNLLSSMMPSNLTLLSEQLCLDESCSEFQLRELQNNHYGNFIKRNTPNLISSRTFGQFPWKGFVADIKFTEQAQFKEHLEKLILNKWLNEKNLIALAIQYNIYNKETLSILTSTIVVQNQQAINIEYHAHQTSTLQLSSSIWNAFIIILLVLNFFFILKVIFEGSINPKPTQIGIFLNSLIEMGFTTVSLMEISLMEGELLDPLKGRSGDCNVLSSSAILLGQFELMTPCFGYILLDSSYYMQQIRLIFQGLCLIFLPFNVFWLVSYVKGTKKVVKFINMIYRTTLHLMKLLFIRVAIYLSWTLAFYIAFRGNFPIFSSYGNSLFCMMVWSLPRDEDEWERGASHTGLYTNALQICLYQFCRVYVYLMLLSFTSIAIYAASDFEYQFRSPQQNTNLENIAANLKQLEKFQKQHLNENEQKKFVSSKVVAWLANQLFSNEMVSLIESECNNNSVKLQMLASTSDLIQYLNFLFQIKPQLLFNSQVYFRIIVDLESIDAYLSEYLQSQERQAQYLNLARLLYLLKDKGSRVPFLLNFGQNNRPSDSIIITFYKIYPYIHLNAGNFDILKVFVLSEDVKQFQNRFEIASDEIQDYEYDDSEQNQLN